MSQWEWNLIYDNFSAYRCNRYLITDCSWDRSEGWAGMTITKLRNNERGFLFFRNQEGDKVRHWKGVDQVTAA